MRKRMTRGFCWAILVLSILFGSLKVFATEEKKHQMVATLCCLNGLHVGNANNCTIGNGTCADHTCALGETEYQSTCGQ